MEGMYSERFWKIVSDRVAGDERKGLGGRGL